MKYIFLLTFMVLSNPSLLQAHDGSAHTDTVWYQEPSLATILIGVALLTMLLVGAIFYLPRYRKVIASLGVVVMLVSFVGLQTTQTSTTPVAESVATQLADLPVTVYRTAGCSCCSGYAKELEAAGAEVVVETITTNQMQEMKREHGIAPEQQSCHTSIMDGYVVEGHVPFAAIAELVEKRPAISGITLPGMPIGTPGMPGKQTEVYNVTTLADELFWQSS